MSDEAHLSAQQARAGPPSRLPVAQRDCRGPQGSARAPRPRPQQAVRLNRLTRRADYLAANSGKRVAMPGFVLLVRRRDDGDSAIRLGITVTKKIGGAVVRNRMKRRFRELARTFLEERGVPGADHVLIGRAGGVERDYDLLGEELTKALDRARR
ncbi:ribonuclease P protein component [Sphingomonas zeicaulis]